MSLLKIFIILFVFSFLFFESVPNLITSSQCDDPEKIVQMKLGLPWKDVPCNYTGLIWGKSIWENLREFSDKSDLPISIKTLVDQGCISYFDGCNNCSIQKGETPVCTLMYCEKYDKPRCLVYKH